MDLTSILLTVMLAVGLTLSLGLVALWMVLRRLAPAPQPALSDAELDAAPKLRGLTVVEERRCAGCRHFNLSAGQRIMQTQPAFFAATAHLEPWQMARQRRVEPNPEYERLEALMLAAAEAGETEEANRLHTKLLDLDPGELEDDTSDIDEAMLNATWQDAGLCGAHKEIRFGPDVCERWSGR